MSCALHQLGFYSIGLGNIPISDLLSHLRTEGAPFVHLRGGPRGYGLTRLAAPQLAAFLEVCGTGPRITMLTSDITLESLVQGRREPCESRNELEQLIAIAEKLGAVRLRLLAPRALEEDEWHAVRVQSPCDSVAVLVELHDPGWFAEDIPERLAQVCADQALGVLLDSAQVAAACRLHGALRVEQAMRHLLPITRVIHFADDGTGLAGPGHELTLAIAQQLGPSVEVAFEWSSQDRSAQAAFAAYRRAEHFWRRHDREPSLECI